MTALLTLTLAPAPSSVMASEAHGPWKCTAIGRRPRLPMCGAASGRQYSAKCDTTSACVSPRTAALVARCVSHSRAPMEADLDDTLVIAPPVAALADGEPTTTPRNSTPAGGRCRHNS